MQQSLASLEAEGLQAFVIADDVCSDIQRAATVIDWTREPWLLLVRAGDELAPGAAALYREAIAGTSADVVYADDDTLGLLGQRKSPYFKPSWNAELYQHYDYLRGACILRVHEDDVTDAAEAQDWVKALTERAIAARKSAHHVKAVLHHRRSRIVPDLPPKALEIARDLPSLSVIIPTRNRADLLSKCIEGLQATRYPSLDVVVVDNDSDEPAALELLEALQSRGVRVLRHPGAFNYSAINNRAVDEARGELICLLNNDIEVLEPDWLEIMATQAMRDDVGAVGAKLLYPDGRLQHAGVVIGVGNAAGHAHRFLRPTDEGYFFRHSLPQYVSAVTDACLVVRRDRFVAAGGLNPDDFPVAFNDVDLCMKLNELGWQSLFEPRAVLIHHESVSRGHDHDPVGAARFEGELAALQRRWKTDCIVDPYHHPQLSRASEQFAVFV